MRVLFVSGIDGFCHRYQVLHRTAQLTALGATTTVRHFADPRLLAEVAQHDVLFLYRVPETGRVRVALEQAADLGIPRIAVIDDLIFVDDASCLPSLNELSPAERDQWRSGVRRYRATIELCDAFVAPTEPLVTIADGLGWRAHLHGNSVAPAELELGRRARAAAARAARPDPVLGYFSGTPTHDEDFASIARALRDVLRAHPAVRLLLVGPLLLPAELEPFADRIERHPLVGWQELPALVAATDVSLAPLCIDRRFAAAKGEIKYLEAAAVGVATVASATSAYRHAICDGETGRLATTQDEWRRALDDLLRDPALRQRLGAAALADVTVRYSERVRGRELLAIVEAVRGGLRRRVQTLVATPPAVGRDVEPAGLVALEPDACPAFAVAVPAAVSPPLATGARIEQRVRVACDGLRRVDVHAVTFGQTLEQRVQLSLRRDDGTLAGHASLDAADAPDRAWLAFELDAPEPRSAGRVYTLEIRAEGTSGGSALSFGVTGAARADDDATAGVVGPALLDGASLDVALALRGFAAWPHALQADDADAAARSRAGAPRTFASADDHDDRALELLAGTPRA